MYLTEKVSTEIARFTPEQAKSYEESLKHYRDLKNSLDTAHDEGYEEGIEEGRKNTILLLHKLGYKKEDIAIHTKTDIDFVDDVLSNE
jgi:flagellar biosynthesis/type III secretory pathway protein FliH